jgi:hypothetical protein
MSFVNISGQSFRFDDETTEPVEEDDAVQRNFPQTESTDPTAIMLLYSRTQ